MSRRFSSNGPSLTLVRVGENHQLLRAATQVFWELSFPKRRYEPLIENRDYPVVKASVPGKLGLTCPLLELVRIEGHVHTRAPSVRIPRSPHLLRRPAARGRLALGLGHAGWLNLRLVALNQKSALCMGWRSARRPPTGLTANGPAGERGRSSPPRVAHTRWGPRRTGFIDGPDPTRQRDPGCVPGRGRARCRGGLQREVVERRSARFKPASPRPTRGGSVGADHLRSAARELRASARCRRDSLGVGSPIADDLQILLGKSRL